MRTIKYVGPHDAVELDLPDGRTIVVKRLDTFESDWPEFSDGLLEQSGNWEAQRSSSTDKKKED